MPLTDSLASTEAPSCASSLLHYGPGGVSSGCGPQTPLIEIRILSRSVTQVMPRVTMKSCPRCPSSGHRPRAIRAHQGLFQWERCHPISPDARKTPPCNVSRTHGCIHLELNNLTRLAESAVAGAVWGSWVCIRPAGQRSPASTRSPVRSIHLCGITGLGPQKLRISWISPSVI